MNIAESLINVCADNPSRLRPCDSGRLFDMALDEDQIKQVKDILRNCGNVDALRSFEEEESEHFTALYQPELIDRDI